MAQTLEELEKRKKTILERIKAKGGAKNAPALKEALAEINNKITQWNKQNGPATTTPTSTNTNQAIADANAIMNPALEFGRNIANEFIPTGSFGQPINVASTPEMTSFLNRLNELSQNAGNLTPLEQESLNNLRAGLGGYTGQETQAMREAAMQEINRQAQTQSRLAQIAQSRSGVRGASALAQMQNIGREAQANTGNFERDLLIRNADEIQRRRMAFGDTVRGTEDARFGRQSTANQMYGGFMGAEEAARTGREQYNNALGANEALARSSTALGGAGTFAGTVGASDSAALAREQLAAQNDWQKKQMEAIQKQIDAYFQMANRASNPVG